MSNSDQSDNSSILDTLKDLESKLEQSAPMSAARGVERVPTSRTVAMPTEQSNSNVDTASMNADLSAAISGSAENRPGVQERSVDSIMPEQLLQSEQETRVLDKAFDEQGLDKPAEQTDESPYVVTKSSTRKDDIAEEDKNKTQVQIDLEELMVVGLGEAFQTMSPKEQEKFKEEGEKTAKKIEILIEKAKLTARKALALIRNWLRLIPGISKFYLEQEAKIKTEEVLRYTRERANKKDIL
ncbi:MAG: hypothetical protein Q8P90_04430 [bacterium]|nr:hypothetical protein [bacterium]